MGYRIGMGIIGIVGFCACSFASVVAYDDAADPVYITGANYHTINGGFGNDVLDASDGGMDVVHGGPGACGEMAPVARRLASARGVLEPIQTALSLEGQVEELRTVATHISPGLRGFPADPGSN